jgi:hypothetical protein
MDKMSDWVNTIMKFAPTVATALGGPLAGAAVSELGSLLGLSSATPETVADAITKGKLTPEQLSAIKQLELKYQNDEKERGFKYAELSFKDREGARQANVSGGTQKPLFWLSLVLLCLTLGTEIYVLFVGYPDTLPDIIVGRVLGLMDAVAMMVLSYWYGTTSGSSQKTQLLAQAEPIKL